MNNPGTVTLSGVSVQSAPGTVTSSSVSVQSAPGTVTSSGVSVQSAPGTVTSSGASVQSAPGTVFWQYSIELYNRAGVKEACLFLQDKCELNVNLILLLCWCEEQQIKLSQRQLQQLITGVKADNEVTQQLRQQRRILTERAVLSIQEKRLLLEQELQQEKVEQMALVNVLAEIQENSDEVSKGSSMQPLALYVKDSHAIAVLRAAFI